MSSVIEPVGDDDKIKTQGFVLTKIDQLRELQGTHTVDVIAVIKEISEPGSIIIKSTGENRERRRVTLIDDSDS